MNLLQNVTKTPVCIVKAQNQWWHLASIMLVAIMWGMVSLKGVWYTCFVRDHLSEHHRIGDPGPPLTTA